jgi:hypothetical protein
MGKGRFVLSCHGGLGISTERRKATKDVAASYLPTYVWLTKARAGENVVLGER